MACPGAYHCSIEKESYCYRYDYHAAASACPLIQGADSSILEVVRFESFVAVLDGYKIRILLILFCSYFLEKNRS